MCSKLSRPDMSSSGPGHLCKKGCSTVNLSYSTSFTSEPGTASVSPSCPDMQQCESDCSLAPMRDECRRDGSTPCTGPTSQKVKVGGNEESSPSGSVERQNFFYYNTSITKNNYSFIYLINQPFLNLGPTQKLQHLSPHETGGRVLFAPTYSLISCLNGLGGTFCQ